MRPRISQTIVKVIGTKMSASVPPILSLVEPPPIDIVAFQQETLLERDLRTALDTGSFQLHWQPIISCTTGELQGFEALIRWNRPGFGLVSPAIFVPLIEKLGLFRKLDAWVVQEACQRAAAWPLHLRAAVNVSACWFDGPGLTSLIADALERSDLQPDRLELEVSEGVVIASKEIAAGELARIKKLGVRLSLDDFGTGYASLGYLLDMPFDKLKIDQSFVRRLGNCRRTEAIVRAILQLGSGLGMNICAEGIERPDQLAILQAYGCDQAQGYLIGRPEQALPDILDFYDRLDQSRLFMSLA